MARLVKFIHNKKEYERLKELTPLFKDELFGEDVQDIIFAGKEKEAIAHCNRSKAQKERWQKQKEAKALGIPYVPETKRRTETYIEPQKEISKKEINPNVGLFRNIKK